MDDGIQFGTATYLCAPVSFSTLTITSCAGAQTHPLTGLAVVDPTRLDRRPMVIKITNFPRSARPQWGLNAADHIYEYYLEDELTRFIGVFYGNDAERVGPIRSARPFDEHIVRAYKGIFAFGYADDRVIDLWEESDLLPFLVIERPGNCPPMCRIGPKSAYITLFTDTALLGASTLQPKGSATDGNGWKDCILMKRRCIQTGEAQPAALRSATHRCPITIGSTMLVLKDIFVGRMRSYGGIFDTHD